MKRSKQLKSGCVFLFLVLCFVAGQAMATTVDLAATDMVTWVPDNGWRFVTPAIQKTGSYYGGCRNYSKFDLSSIAAPAGYTLQIDSVTFKVYAAGMSSHANPFVDSVIAVTDNSWTGATISGTNAALGSVLGTMPTYASYSWNTVSNAALASFVQTQANSVDKKVSFALGTLVLDGSLDEHDWYTYHTLTVDYSFVAIPEPATLTILAAGLVGLFRSRKHV